MAVSADAPSGAGRTEAPQTQGASRRTLVLLAVILCAVALRLVALGSDPYTRLDWSAGLLTDEGFYIHNARNVALFGHARTDDFNNMLLSPLLHWAQVGMFEVFGAGAIQARLISVAASLATLALMYAALRRSFDNRIALTAVAFLGLDHANLLYNRMALMDTPAALPAAAAFYLFVRGTEAGRSKAGRAGRTWFAATGLALGLTVVCRMLCLYLAPAPFLALLPLRRGGVVRRAMAWMAAGFALVAAVYAVGWYLPNRAEIAPMNAYYRTHQIQPRSVSHLLENVRHALVGDFRGLSPYLFRHTPALFGLALTALATGVIGRRSEGESNEFGRVAERYLGWWLGLGCALLAVISYSPSRYYVTLYPALAGIAAITVWRLPEAWAALGKPGLAPRAARGILAGFLAFHAILSLVHYGGAAAALLYGVPVAIGVAAAAWPVRARPIRRVWAAAVVLVVWAVVNCAWLADWGRHIDYSQRDMSVWLGQHLPTGSAVIGDVAPGICMDNRFRAIHVQPGLANYVDPLERFRGAPRYVAILDGRWKERYWLDKYPDVVAPNRRIHLARILRWEVGIYAVDAPPK